MNILLIVLLVLAVILSLFIDGRDFNEDPE